LLLRYFLDFKSIKILKKFILFNKENIYIPKLLVSYTIKSILDSQKNFATSKLLVTEGRLLPPSEDIADKLGKLFGLQPKDYGNDEVVVRGNQIEYRGKEIYFTGIVENRSNMTLDVNILGIFQFLKVSQTSFFFFTKTSKERFVSSDIFKIKNIKPKERKAFVFKVTSGKGSGIKISGLSSQSRVLLESYTSMVYIPLKQEITDKEYKNQKSLLEEVGLDDVDLSKVQLAEVRSILNRNIQTFSSEKVVSKDYQIISRKNAYIKISRIGGGSQVDIVPSGVCKDTFLATTSEGKVNKDFRKDYDFYIGSFPVEVNVRYIGGCGAIFDGEKKEISVKVKLYKQGAYKIFNLNLLKNFIILSSSISFIFPLFLILRISSTFFSPIYGTDRSCSLFAVFTFMRRSSFFRLPEIFFSKKPVEYTIKNKKITKVFCFSKSSQFILLNNFSSSDLSV